MKKILLLIFLLACVIGFSIYYGAMFDGGLAEKQYSQNSKTPATETVVNNQTIYCPAAKAILVTHVIDGDTLIVEGGVSVRLIGIDADEKNESCYQDAKNRLEELVLNKVVLLEKDISDVDQYKRCLRTIFVGDENMGVKLVKEGLASARFYPPDGRHKDEIFDAEAEAMKNRVGCEWSNIK